MVKLIATSVVLGIKQGESHGGVYIVDVEAQDVRQVIDCVTTEAGGQGRDWEHGPRGVAIDNDTVYIVASDELLAFSPRFELTGSWKSPYLQNGGEVSVYQRNLYIASAGYDSILAFDLDDKKFRWALHVDLDRFEFTGATYDPLGADGPLLLNKLHLTGVHANEHGMYITGGKSGGMVHFNGEALNMSVTLPDGTHNARPFRDGVLFNDSEACALRYASRTGEEDRALKVPLYDDTDVSNDGAGDARQGFARGLCLLNDRVAAGGSSPATIALHDLQDSKTLLSVNLSRDIRNAIHSIEIWPF